MAKTIPARVLDKEDKELYQEAFAKTAEKYGKDSLAYQTITNGIDKENVTGSQFLWNTELNKFLPRNQRVILLEDFEKIFSADENFFNGFYTDANQLIIRSNKPTWVRNEFILKDLIKQVGNKYEFSPENPLILTNLELVEDKNSKNKYGLLLKIGKDTKIQNDKIFAYGNNRIQLGDLEKKIFYTKKDGLSWVFLGRYDYLFSRDDVLDGSGVNGRVVVVKEKKLMNKFLSQLNF